MIAGKLSPDIERRIEEEKDALRGHWDLCTPDSFIRLGAEIAIEMAAERAELRARKWHDHPLSSISEEANTWAHDEAVVIWRSISALANPTNHESEGDGGAVLCSYDIRTGSESDRDGVLND